MNQIRKRLTYANVMSSIAVFLVLGGATAVAANQLGKNSVGTAQLKKNAVSTAKLKKNSVSTAKIKKNAIGAVKIKSGAVTGAKISDGAVSGAKISDGAVTSAKIANGAVTGDKVNVATLGTVPRAANLEGQTSFFLRLGFGQSQTIASNGAVSFVAECAQEGGDDIARILFQTTVNGSVAIGEDEYEGGPLPSDFLNADTPASERLLVDNEATSGEVSVSSDIDEGFVMSPEGKVLTANSEGIVLGLNYGAPGCLFAGVVNAIG